MTPSTTVRARISRVSSRASVLGSASNVSVVGMKSLLSIRLRGRAAVVRYRSIGLPALSATARTAWTREAGPDVPVLRHAMYASRAMGGGVSLPVAHLPVLLRSAGPQAGRLRRYARFQGRECQE